MLRTLGILVIAALTILAHTIFNYDLQVCLGTVGLVVGGIYFVTAENPPNLFSNEYKKLLPYIIYMLFCISCIIGAENVKTLVKLWKEFL